MVTYNCWLLSEYRWNIEVIKTIIGAHLVDFKVGVGVGRCLLCIFQGIFTMEWMTGPCPITHALHYNNIIWFSLCLGSSTLFSSFFRLQIKHWIYTLMALCEENQNWQHFGFLTNPVFGVTEIHPKASQFFCTKIISCLKFELSLVNWIISVAPFTKMV